jgi:hypothetical protein
MSRNAAQQCCSSYHLCNLVYLFYGREFLSKSKLMLARIRFCSSIGSNLLNIDFSKILLIIGSWLIGLYELASSNGLPGFRIIMICATFR